MFLNLFLKWRSCLDDVWIVKIVGFTKSQDLIRYTQLPDQKKLKLESERVSLTILYYRYFIRESSALLAFSVLVNARRCYNMPGWTSSVWNSVHCVASYDRFLGHYDKWRFWIKTPDVQARRRVLQKLQQLYWR